MPRDVRALHDEGGTKAVEGVKGIGKSSGTIIVDFLQTGRSVDYDELLASIPAGLLDLLDIPGMGPKTVQAVWQEKGVTSVDELSEAIADDTLEGIKGLGARKSSPKSRTASTCWPAATSDAASARRPKSSTRCSNRLRDDRRRQAV